MVKCFSLFSAKSCALLCGQIKLLSWTTFRRTKYKASQRPSLQPEPNCSIFHPTPQTSTPLRLAGPSSNNPCDLSKLVRLRLWISPSLRPFQQFLSRLLPTASAIVDTHYSMSRSGLTTSQERSLFLPGRSSRELRGQPGFGEIPIPLQRGDRDAQHFRRVLLAQPAEEAQLNHLRRSGI